MGMGLALAVEWSTVGVSRSGARQSLGLGSWVHGLMNWWVMPIPGKGDISISACALSAPKDFQLTELKQIELTLVGPSKPLQGTNILRQIP